MERKSASSTGSQPQGFQGLNQTVEKRHDTDAPDGKKIRYLTTTSNMYCAGADVATSSFGPSFSNGISTNLRIPRYALPHEELTTLNRSYARGARSPSPLSSYVGNLSGSTQVQSPDGSSVLDLPPCDPTLYRSNEGLFHASDFTALGRLGKGAHGEVLLVQDNVSQKYLALKVVEKEHLHLTSYPRIFEEQLVGKKLVNCPWALHLEGSFQDKEYFYFLSTYHRNGDLTKLVRRYGKLQPRVARHYAAELIAAMDEFHRHRIMHRDIKPDNILIDDEGHLVLADFGVSCSMGDSSESRPWERHKIWARTEQGRSDTPGDQAQCDRTYTSCGTPGFMAPEMFGSEGYSYEADIWSMGVVIHFLLMGRLPFGMIPARQSYKELSTRTKVLQLEFGTDERVPGHARTLLRRMLEKDPARRISMTDIKQHAFFAGICWDTLSQRKTVIEFPLILAYLHEKKDSSLIEDGVTIPSGTAFKVGESPFPWFDHSPPLLQAPDSTEPTSGVSQPQRKASLAKKFKGLWKRNHLMDHDP